MSTVNDQIPNPRKNARRVQAAIALFAVACIAGAIYQAGLDAEVTEDAYVGGNLVQVTAQIGGTVTAIKVDDTDKVGQGQGLVELSDVDQLLALESAKAALGTSVRTAKGQFLRVRELEGEVSLRQSDYQKASDDYAIVSREVV
ncbi:biotin/lipoyl-binding protein [Pseudomonas parafulva]|uniref:biotin/lipoyl-binding protein n=1 Tax=Pseudomonas parafulva TaxID=157782 RepID=UPI000540F086|nr:biotin/lipoyl-binding protein [Pseudomonas parafulva]AIZ35425.1 hypothetical protein NJ69_21695 [Pseudomonas parafulva]